MDRATTFPDSPFSYRRALLEGVPREALRHAVDQGEVRRVARGVYALPEPLGATQERWELVRADHVRRLREALQRHPTAVASHASAALLHGLELVMAPAAEVEITVVEAVARSRREHGVVLHHTDSTTTPWELVDGLRVTPIARTVADVLRTRRLPHGVAMLDRALVGGRTDVRSVEVELGRQRRWRGRPRALQALRLADTRRESWLESYSFVALHETGLPLPLPQVDVLDERLSFVGRVDGLMPGGVFLEADGEGKYFLESRSAGAGESARARLAAERTRHERLERLGLVGVRWTAEEIMREPLDVAGRIKAARRRACSTRFRGWVRHAGRVGRLHDLLPQEGWSG